MSYCCMAWAFLSVTPSACFFLSLTCQTSYDLQISIEKMVILVELSYTALAQAAVGFSFIFLPLL